LTGWLHLEAKDFKRAEEAFQALIKEPSTKNDAYGWLGLACLNFASAPSHQRLKVVATSMQRAFLRLTAALMAGADWMPFCPVQGKDIERAQKLYGRAMGFFKHILEWNSANVYAANGIAAVLAEQGDIEQARKILTQVLPCGAFVYSVSHVPPHSMLSRLCDKGR
jgi:tetratricopeptide (TPR) repeat protein